MTMARRTDLRDALRVKPGTRVRLGDARPGATHGCDKDVGGAELDAAARPPDRPPGPPLGRGEALGAGRPPGHRRRRQGRHDQQGHGGVQPAGLPGHVVQGARPPRSSPTTTSGGSTRRVPRKGEIGIFNRSHYEDVLVVRVHDLVPKAVWSKRYDQINAFERISPTTGTTIVKFFLSIDRTSSASGSRPATTTRPSAGSSRLGDLEERKLWDDYQAAFDDALSKTLDRRRRRGTSSRPTASGSGTSRSRRSSPTRSRTCEPAYPAPAGPARRPRHRVAAARSAATCRRRTASRRRRG